MICCFLLQSGLAFAAVPPITAKSAVLIEARTGKVIYAKDAESRLYPASTTKMMTLLVALEKGNLADVVTVGPHAAGTEGSSMELEAGDRLRLEDLLYGIMLVSGNDATIAVAEHVAGSVGEFTVRMTKKAAEIGAKNTQFANSSGLPDPAHYSTAHDLARIAAYGYRNPLFREIVSTKERKVEWFDPDKELLLENTNHLLWSYPGSIGTKTGYTKVAGECLVASAERDGLQLIAVVMHSDTDQRWSEAAALLDYGFERVNPKIAYAKDVLAKEVRVHGGTDYQVAVRPRTDIRFPVIDGDDDHYSIQSDIPAFVNAPVKEGQSIGSIRILYDKEVVDNVDLIADTAVAEGFNLTSMLAIWYDRIYAIMKQLMFQG